jgi:N utilization substance protein A
MKINQEEGRVAVFMKPDQVSLAIGKGGQNIKLASRLVGLEIDVFREQEEYDEDIALDEFSDEIEAWVIDEFKKIGLDTAKSVLAVSKEDLVRRTELEEETIEDVLNIIRNEFDAEAENDSEEDSESEMETESEETSETGSETVSESESKPEAEADTESEKETEK